MKPEIIPYLVRADRNGEFKNQQTVVWPTAPADSTGTYFTAYDKNSGHGACSWGWYMKTKPAEPDEDTQRYIKHSQELIDKENPGKYIIKLYRRTSLKMDETRRNIARHQAISAN